MTPLFFPQSIAIIGASTDPTRLGYSVLKNLTTLKFKGKIYPVNPRLAEILGLKVIPDVSQLPNNIDQVIVAVNVEATIQIMENIAAKKPKVVVIASGGFKEVGGKGRKVEEYLLQIAKAGNFRIIGPNCQGVINPHINMNATLDPQVSFLKPGVICFLSQGGDSGHGVLMNAKAEGIGISKYVGMGNMCDIDFVDLLQYLKDDEATKVIMLYIAGIDRGREFYRVSREITASKPVVAFKIGKTEVASRVETTHTGSLTGSYQVYQSAFKQAGIISCEEPLEMLDVAKALAMQPPPKANQIAIVSVVGGPGVTAAETCALKGIKLSKLSETTRNELRRVLPAEAGIMNPIDLTWAGNSTKTFVQVLRIIAGDQNVYGIIVIRKMGFAEEPTPEIVEAMLESKKPIVACWLGEREPGFQAIKLLQERGIPAYPSSDRAAKAMAGLVRYNEIRNLKRVASQKS